MGIYRERIQGFPIPPWDPNDKDYSILGSLSGATYFGKLHLKTLGLLWHYVQGENLPTIAGSYGTGLQGLEV